MPEGDTIFRTAARLREVVTGATVTAASGNGRQLAAASLLGATFASVEARGKHLLMALTDSRVLHSHMGMTGAWHIYSPGDAWRKSSRLAAIALHLGPRNPVSQCNSTPRPEHARGPENTVRLNPPVAPVAASVANARPAGSCVVCFSPKTLELLTAAQFRRHAFLRRLGPDLLQDELDAGRVLERFRSSDAAPMGEAVMNQTIVSGIGNVYKSETLFLTRTDPFARVSELADATILQIVETARELLRRNLGGYPRRTRGGGDGQRLWVYGRNGQPCLRCGQIVALRRQGDLGRTTYWCPNCQGGGETD